MRTVIIAFFLLLKIAWCEEKIIINYPANVEFLDLPLLSGNGSFFVDGGKAYWGYEDNDKPFKGRSIILPKKQSPEALKFKGEGIYILGSPAIIFSKEYLDVKSLIINDNGMPMAVKANGEKYVFVEKRSSGFDGELVSQDEVYESQGNFKKVATILNSHNAYREIIRELYEIDPGIIAMLTSSTRQSYINTMMLIDSRNWHIVGLIGFGTIRYDSRNKIFRLTEAVINCENQREILKQAEENAMLIPLYEGKEISKKLTNGIANSGFSIIKE